MSFFKNPFKKSKQERKLNNAKDLCQGDIIVMSDSFGLPESLRSQQFQVSAINSYEYEHNTQTEWVLQGNNNIELYLTLDIDDKTYLKFSLKIAHDDVECLFDLDQFASLFDEPGDAQLDKQSDSQHTTGWSAQRYQQAVFAQVGYFHRKDHRTQAISQYQEEDSGEQFELYVLYNDDQDRGIDVEVWQDGDTDIFLTLYRPLTDIIDMYPGS